MKTVLLLTSSFLLAACANAPVAEAEPSPEPQLRTEVAITQPAEGLSQAERFEFWKGQFVNAAISKNYAPDLVRSVILPAKINPLALERDANQPEFTKPVWSYVVSAASEARISGGQNKMTEVDPVLDTIEARAIDRRLGGRDGDDAIHPDDLPRLRGRSGRQWQ